MSTEPSISDLLASMPEPQRREVEAMIRKLVALLCPPAPPPPVKKRRAHVPTSLVLPPDAEAVRARLDREGVRRVR